MAQNYNPAIVTNNLLFCYDAPNLKSYKGPILQNLSNAISIVGTGTATGYSSAASTELVNIPGLGENLVYTNTIQNNFTSFSPNSSNCCPSLHQWGGFSVSPSTLYTYGIVYRVDSGYTNSNYMYRYEFTSNGGSYVTEAGVHTDANRISLGDGWFYAWNTFTTQSTTNWIGGAGTWYYRYSQTADRLSVARVMVAPGNFAGLHPRYWPSPATSRTNTQAILDITAKNTITANSLTYANDSFSFNGTSNYISSTLSSSYSNYSIELWIKMNSLSGQQRFFSTDGGGTFTVRWNGGDFDFHYNPFDGSPSSVVTSATGITYNTTNYYHLVATNSITNGARFYVNGELRGTNERAINLTGTMFFGADRTLSLWTNCILPTARIYSKELTIGEIKQNYNAYRGRYNL